jgi:hypothetical protein
MDEKRGLIVAKVFLSGIKHNLNSVPFLTKNELDLITAKIID